MGNSDKAKKLPPLRIEITLDNCANGPQERATAEALRQFFADASSAIHEKCEVVMFDPAQIFHEKTDILNTRTMPKEGSPRPKKLAAMERDMQKGRYEVAEPQALEQRYYDALRQVVFDAENLQNGSYLRQEKITAPEDIHMGQLQELYIRHIKDLPRDSAIRELDSFRAYAGVRADCGEQAVAQHVAERDHSSVGERVVSLFVTVDRGALEQVAEAGRAAEKKFPQQFQSHAVHSKDFPALAEALTQSMKQRYPACADIPFGAAGSHVEQLRQSREAVAVHSR